MVDRVTGLDGFYGLVGSYGFFGRHSTLLADVFAIEKMRLSVYPRAMMF
jgi:hypothetical protein